MKQNVADDVVFGRPFVKRFALCCLSVCPVCSVGVLWPNGWMDQDPMEIGLGPGVILSDADPAPSPLKRHSPQFSANVRCGQTVGWTKMPLVWR